jgi:hypothetical protein
MGQIEAELKRVCKERSGSVSLSIKAARGYSYRPAKVNVHPV